MFFLSFITKNNIYIIKQIHVKEYRKGQSKMDPGRDEIETPYSRTSVNRPGRDEIETPYSRTSVNRPGRDTKNNIYIIKQIHVKEYRKGQSKMDNPEKLAI
jgi:hypothetical protein